MSYDYDAQRKMFVNFTLNAYAPQLSPDELQAFEPVLKAHIAATYTDEVLFQDFQRMAEEKRAQDLAYWESYHAADAAKKATKAHQDRLAAAYRATEVERERAEAAEDKVRELNHAMDDDSH
jgi:hypothetical protein